MSGLAEILEENQRLRRELADRDARLQELMKHNDALAQELWLVRQGHRGPASQRYVPDGQEHLPMFASVPPPPQVPVREPEEDDAAADVVPERVRKGPKRRNREAFQDLPSQPMHCAAAPSACASCGGPMVVIGQAESTRVDWIPGHFVRLDITRDKCACPHCPGEGVLTVPGPFALERSLPGNGLVARVLVDKFADHIPGNRQAKRMAREGFEIGSHTISSWVCKAGELLERVAEAVHADLLAGSFIQGDDTGMPVQDGGDGQLRKGRLWAFTDQEQVFYAFTDTKEGVFPSALLEGYAGDLLVVDGGSEFNQVVREQELVRGGCWSHLRKRFVEALHHHPAEAHIAITTIKDLFMLERGYRSKSPDEVVALRQAQSKPLVDGLFRWMQGVSQLMRPESLLGKAIQYGRNQEAPLRVFLDHGEAPMHNNLSELMLRQAVVGRKNWLFARSEGGAHAAATIYTLIGSCQLQGIDPWVYLHDVLGRLLDHPAKRVGELTPKQWLLAKQGHTGDGR